MNGPRLVLELDITLKRAASILEAPESDGGIVYGPGLPGERMVRYTLPNGCELHLREGATSTRDGVIVHHGPNWQQP